MGHSSYLAAGWLAGARQKGGREEKEKEGKEMRGLGWSGGGVGERGATKLVASLNLTLPKKRKKKKGGISAKLGFPLAILGTPAPGLLQPMANEFAATTTSSST